MPANDNVTVRIVGDASGVAPAVEEAGSSLAGLEGILKEMNSQLAVMSTMMREAFMSGAAGANQLREGLQGARAATEAENNALTRMVMKVHEGAESIRTFQMRAKAFAEVYVGIFAVETVARWAESLGAAAEKTEHLAAKLGMTVAQVQGLSGAAQMSGTNIDALAKAIGMMDNKALQSGGSTSSVTKAFKAVGISANDGASNMDRLLKIADKFHDMADGPTKVALSMQLLGRSGREAIPFLNQGSAAIQDLMQRTKELGGVNEHAVEVGARLAASVNESKVAWAGLKNTLTEAFGPILTQLTDGFIELVKYMRESYDSGGLVKVIFDTIAEVMHAVMEVVSAVGLAFESVFQATGGEGVTWSEAIKTAVETVVMFLKLAIATVVFVADAFIAAFFMIKAGVENFVANWKTQSGQIQLVGIALGEFMKVLGKVCEDALMLRWGSISADWNSGMEHVRQVVHDKAQQILAETSKLRQQAESDFNAAMDVGANFRNFAGKLFDPAQGTPKHDAFKFKFGGGGGEAPDISSPSPKGKGEKKGMSLAEKLEAELEAKKTAWAMEQDAQGSFEQYSLQSEADFWSEALKRTDLGAKDKLAIEKKYLAARQALKQQEIATQLDGYQEQLEAAGSSWEKKLEILRAEQAYVTRMYGAQSREARQAADAVVRAEREKAAQLRELEGAIGKAKEDSALAGVDAEQAAAESEVEMGRRTQAQLLAQERKFEAQRFEIKRKALLDTMRLAQLDPNTSPEKLRQIQSQMEDLERQHQARLTQIDRQATLQRTQLQRGAIRQVASSWSQAIAQMVTLQMSWRDGIKAIYQGLVQTVASVLQQIIEKWVAAFLTKLILGKQEAAQSVASYVGEAGAGGVASMAAAPFPMNLTAPAFGASMAAAAAAAGSVASAEGGDWRVRGGMYRLHDEEMVLPAWAAQPLRDMIQGRSGTNFNAPAAANDGGRDNLHLHLHGSIIHSPQQLRRWFEDNSHAVGQGVRHFVRQGGNTSPNRR